MSIAFLLFAQLAAGVPAFEASAVPDVVLAEQRGGVRLPNGIDLALSVQTDTSVNGALVLRTVFSVQQGPPKLTILAPKPGETVPAAARAIGAPLGASTPVVTYDRRNGLQVTTASIAMPTVTSRRGIEDGTIAAGLQVIDPSPSVSTDAGTITETTQDDLTRVTLTAADLSITHFSGQAFGSAIANAGSDRAISTDTSISIDLRDAGPDVLGSSMLRVESVALDALSSRL